MLEFKDNPLVKMAIRPHRGGLADAMAEAKEIPKTKDALLDEINQFQLDCFKEVTADDIKFGEIVYDRRIDWYSRIVVIRDYGVWGFIDDRPEC